MNEQFDQNLTTGFNNMKEFYLKFRHNNKNENEDERQRINSSYHKKRVYYHRNANFETSFKEEKLYSKKIVQYLSNNNNSTISINKEDKEDKEDYFNKSQPQIRSYDNYNFSYKSDRAPNKYNNKINLITSLQKDKDEDNNNINNNNFNSISKSPPQQGIYKKKRIIYSKNNNMNKNMNNSCLIGEVNKSNFGLNNTIESEKDFMNNSMVMRRKKINNYRDIYYPKHVNPNVADNEYEYNSSKYDIREQPEFTKIQFINNNVPYQKINIRYQKMYYDNDLNSEYRQINNGILEEQTNEGTGSIY